MASGRSPRRLLIFVVLLVAAFLAGRISAPDSSQSGPPGVNSADGPTLTERPSRPPPTPGVLRKSARTIDGNTITVHEVQAPARPDEQLSLSADEGMQLTAADIEYCVREDLARSVNVTEQEFTLETSDNRRWGPWEAPESAKSPRVGNRSIQPGQCVRGWITFQTPKDGRIAMVHWASGIDPSDTLSWKNS